MHKFYFNPKNGKYNFELPLDFKLLPTKLKDKRHVMEIKEYSQRRSLGANAYYWKIVIPYFLAEWGMDPKIKSHHRYMHYDILGEELRQIEDERRPGKTKTEQTSTMTGSEFWKYIYRCEKLYHDNYNGSFPPPKRLGYDTKKK